MLVKLVHHSSTTTTTMHCLGWRAVYGIDFLVLLVRQLISTEIPGGPDNSTESFFLSSVSRCVVCWKVWSRSTAGRRTGVPEETDSRSSCCRSSASTWSRRRHSWRWGAQERHHKLYHSVLSWVGFQTVMNLCWHTAALWQPVIIDFRFLFVVIWVSRHPLMTSVVVCVHDHRPALWPDGTPKFSSSTFTATASPWLPSLAIVSPSLG